MGWDEQVAVFSRVLVQIAPTRECLTVVLQYLSNSRINRTMVLYAHT